MIALPIVIFNPNTDKHSLAVRFGTLYGSFLEKEAHCLFVKGTGLLDSCLQKRFMRRIRQNHLSKSNRPALVITRHPEVTTRQRYTPTGAFCVWF